MSTNSFVASLTAVAATGDLKQIYPDGVVAGVAPATAVRGELIRHAREGLIHSITIYPDGTNGGILQVYDINGADAGADVSSATAITNAQLTSLMTRGLAKLIFEIEFAGTVGSGPSPYSGVYRTVSRGLAMRFTNAGPTGAVKVNLNTGGILGQLLTSAGA